MKKIAFVFCLLAGAAMQAHAQGCSSCGDLAAAGAAGEDVGPSLSISLGTAQYGQSVGFLTFDSSVTNASLFTPVALQYNAPTRTDVLVVTTNIITTNLTTTIETDGVLVTNSIYYTNAIDSSHIVAGNGVVEARLTFPTGVAMDGSGNLYIADYGNNRIRKVDSSGIITTVAGNGTAGYSGDGGAAASAKLSSPTGVAVDGSGNLYIADYGNDVIRKVSASGIITTSAGAYESYDYSGDGGAATSASLYDPQGVAVDGSGNLYIADYGNNVIRKVDSFGTITTLAGNGTGGD